MGLIATSFISAGWFSEIFEKINPTGNVIDSSTISLNREILSQGIYLFKSRNSFKYFIWDDENISIEEAVSSLGNALNYITEYPSKQNGGKALRWDRDPSKRRELVQLTKGKKYSISSSNAEWKIRSLGENCSQLKMIMEKSTRDKNFNIRHELYDARGDFNWDKEIDYLDVGIFEYNSNNENWCQEKINSKCHEMFNLLVYWENKKSVSADILSKIDLNGVGKIESSDIRIFKTKSLDEAWCAEKLGYPLAVPVVETTGGTEETDSEETDDSQNDVASQLENGLQTDDLQGIFERIKECNLSNVGSSQVQNGSAFCQESEQKNCLMVISKIEVKLESQDILEKYQFISCLENFTEFETTKKTTNPGLEDSLFDFQIACCN